MSTVIRRTAIRLTIPEYHAAREAHKQASRQETMDAISIIPTVIECAAELVDSPTSTVSDEYRRGVVELATRLCLCGDDWDDAVTVMGYAVCGVNKPAQEGASA